MSSPPSSMDDLVLMKRRQDEFRAGYANWRAGGVKGATGQLGLGAPIGEGSTGEAGFRAGNINWRQGGSAGAKGASAATGQRTRNVGRLMSTAQAAAAASKGESWVRFFLHPDSDFFASMEGEVASVPLCAANLPDIARNIRNQGKTNARPLPAYARAVDGFDGVLCHIGVGGFHRSHQAVYTHQVLNAQIDDETLGGGERWAFVGIALMPWDRAMADCLKKQDGLFTVLGRDPESTTGTVVGSVVDCIYGPDDPTGSSVILRLAHPQTRIVSLTITEKGYCLDVHNHLDMTNPLVRHDLDDPTDRPQSAVGTIAAALALRRDRGLAPFTVLSCDNLPGNGHLAKAMVLKFLEARGDEALTAWAAANCEFPNTMVDRITPATKPPQAGPDVFSDGIRALVRDTVGVDDDWPVIAESYTQWVIEDKFTLGRPAWETQGALFVPDVHPYEMMKLRLLNAGHSAISYASYLMQHRYVDSAMDPHQTPWHLAGLTPEQVQSAAGRGTAGSVAADPTVGEAIAPGANPVRAFCAALFEEATPTVPDVPGVDTASYKVDLLKRFSNPYIKDTLQRLAEDGSMKLCTTLRDAAFENATAGRPVPFFAFVVATWFRYLVGVDEQGSPIMIKDPRLTELQPLARACFGVTAADCEAQIEAYKLSLENGNGDGDGSQWPVKAPAEPPVALLELVFGEELSSIAAVAAAVHTSCVEVATTSTRAAMSKLLA